MTTLSDHIAILQNLPYDRMTSEEIEIVTVEISQLQSQLYQLVFGKPLAEPEISEDVEVWEAIEYGLTYAHDIYKRVDLAKQIMVQYGGIDGGHHKEWCLDQMFRALTGPSYHEEVAAACDGEDGPNSYDWSEGCCP